MRSAWLRAPGPAGILASALFMTAGPALAAPVPAPAPLVGVTGPIGIVAAAIGYGSYLLVKRYRSR